MEYQCSVCGQMVGREILVYMDHTEKHIIDLIQHDHPDWKEDDGVCRKCKEYYEAELKGAPFGDAPCALRRRKVKKFWDTMKKIFHRIGKYIKFH